VDRLKRVLRRIDEYQQRHAWLAFPFAVVKKFGDDRAGNLAALIAYYGFFSLFPLLLALVTILAFVLRAHPELQHRIVDSALAEFPIVGGHIRGNLHAIRGSGLLLVVSLLASLWSGLGVVRTSQGAMDDVWDVPRRERQGLVPSVLRAVALLVAFGIALAVTAGLSSLGGSSGGLLGPGLRVLAFVGTLALDLAIFLVAFRLLTVADVTWGDVFPGAAVAAVGWAALQMLGTFLVRRELNGATEVYGFFAIVIGLLWWIFLGAQLTLFAAEINVVRARRLWPRGLANPPLTPEDRQAMASYAREEERRPEESVDVRFDRSASGGRQEPSAAPTEGRRDAR
jgi:YihY family inner membrane protein